MSSTHASDSPAPTLAQLLDGATAPTVFARAYLDHVARLLSRIDEGTLGDVIEVLARVREARGTVYIMGNGGSAMTAGHFANDLVHGTGLEENPFRVVNLAGEPASLTALANDISFEEVFARRMRGLVVSGDAVIAISASGNSPNILRGVEYATGRGATTIAFTGFDGGKLKACCDLCVHVQTEAGEYGPVEGLHLVLLHLVTNYLSHVLRTPTAQQLET